MSLLQKASIITTPTAYAEDYLYSIKPAYALGSELVTQFDDVADGTDVTTLAGWAAYGVVNSRNVVDEKLVINISTGNTGAVFNFTTETDKKYLFTCNITGDLGLGGVYVQSTNPSPYAVVYTNNLDTSSGKINLVLSGLGVDSQIYFRASNNNAGITTYSDISVKEITDADFDFDRNSTGTRVNENYLIEDVPYNLASYSENISVWDNFRVDVELSNVLNPFKSGYVYLVDDGTVTDNHYRKKSYIYLDSSYTYTQSFFVKKKDDGVYPVLRTSGVGGNSFVTFNWDTETLVQGSDITSSKVEKYNYGWYRISMVFSNLATTDFIIGISNDVNDDLPTYTGSNKGFYVWGCQIVKGDQPKDYLKTTDRLDIPRIDYTNGEPSILLEPSRTNEVEYSNDIGSISGLSAIGSSITTNNISSPEGLTSVALLKENSANSSHFIFKDFSLTNPATYTISLFAKSNGGRNLRLGDGSVGWSSGFNANFDLTKGTSDNGTMVNYGNGWYRCSVQGTTNASTSRLIIYSTDGTTTSYQGDNASGVNLYGFQIEEGSYATSLIHTSGSAVTRSADSANNAGNSDLINSTEGVLYAEIKALADDGTFRLITISAGANNNIVKFGYRSTSQAIYYEVRSGNVSQAFQIYTTQDVLEYHKVAIKYKENDFALYINGSEVMTDNSGIVPVGMNSLQFEDFVGNCKMIAVFKEALTDLELEKLTGYNNHELYMNYYNRLSYLGLAEEYNVESDINNYIL